MRVITGSARGRRLATPAGPETRPTAARVKEGVFSALQFEIEGRHVLDLFAGAGQLGIECLSRGAASAVFVDRRTAPVVRENLRNTGLGDRAAVLAGDALEYLAGTRDRFDLIFLDPPYGTGLLEESMERIAAFDILRPHGIMVAEHPAERAVIPPPPCRLWRSYRYGRVAVTLCRRDAASGEEETP